MTVDVSTLDTRTPANLRSFVNAQRIGVLRRPDDVAPANPSEDSDYWRFLRRRVKLEGICAHYQTYDNSGDENDWNLNIVPDPAYSWMLDPALLYALSLSSGAPRPLDLCEIKRYEGSAAIECELTPDDALYDKFVSSALPITSGGWWPDEDEQQGLGPTGRRVGVYGVFCGDYGHGGRPEIHPFDAFWRRYHTPRSDTVSWDLGVFQDDSNRFNDDWSKAPIDVEFKIPFCLDVPVTLRETTTATTRFTLRRSPRCSAVAKNTRPGGTASVTETFTAATVRLNPLARNRLTLTVEDLTEVPGRPFALRFDDLTYTVTRLAGLWTLRAWLAGSIVVRVAIDQDGFAYWNLTGPNSTTAAVAPSDEHVDDEVGVEFGTDRSPEPRVVALRVLEARPVLAPDAGTLPAGEVVVEQALGKGDTQRRTVRVQAREEPVLVIDDETTVTLESFDLFPRVDIAERKQPATSRQLDITAAIGRIAGLERLGRRLRPTPATVEIDEFVTLDVTARYAPFRDGAVFGEERSMLSESLSAVIAEPLGLRSRARITNPDGIVRTLATGDGQALRDPAGGAPRVSTTAQDIGHRVVIGPFGEEPVTVRFDAIVDDGAGLQAGTAVSVQNYRIVEPRSWLEEAAGLSLDELHQRSRRLGLKARTAPEPATLATEGMVRCLLEAVEVLDTSRAAPAAEVAGAVRLAARIDEILAEVGRR